MPKTQQQIMFGHITHWQQSGSSQKAWCQQHDISYATFHYWYRRFRNRQLSDQQHADAGFLPLVVGRQSAHPWCELLFSDGRRLIFNEPVPTDLLLVLLV